MLLTTSLIFALFSVIPSYGLTPLRPVGSSRVDRLMRSINSACRRKGGVYAEYSCKTVSWDDGDRGTVDGELSVWGSSITDTRLWAKDGTQLFTVRSDNWNEKLGHVRADDIKILVGNEVPGGGNMKTVTLREFLKNAGLYGAYAGLPPSTNFNKLQADDKVSIRFQTTFLPVEDREKATLEFATEAYNYNTISDNDPKNIVVLATTQGIAVQQDGEGAKKLYHHDVDSSGSIHRYWLEAERSKHKVGGPQTETEQERIDAKNRGKATAEEIGIDAMGKRFNVLMTIQIPLKQKNPNAGGVDFMSGGSCPNCGMGMGGGGGYPAPMSASVPGGSQITSTNSFRERGLVDDEVPEKEGVANAARVSRGSEVDTWEGLSIEDPKRHPSQHVTVTAVIYNTIAGGVPKLNDVVAAIDDMERLYKACDWNGHLKDKEANFMKNELKNDTMNAIWGKVATQPHYTWPWTGVPVAGGAPNGR